MRVDSSRLSSALRRTLPELPLSPVVPIPVDLRPMQYAGPNFCTQFVVGYGLDYAGRYRSLPYVGILKPVDAAPAE